MAEGSALSFIISFKPTKNSDSHPQISPSSDLDLVGLTTGQSPVNKTRHTYNLRAARIQYPSVRKAPYAKY